MADDNVSGSLLEDLRMDALHEEHIAAALAELKERCEELRIPFAVIGALAMRRHGYRRFTEDIDIVTTPGGLDLIHEHLVGRGLRPRGPALRKKLRDTARAVNIHVIQSGERAGSAEGPIVYPEPASAAFVLDAADGIAYARLDALITFKLGSGIWGNRPRDLVDVQELVKANGLDESFAERLPEPVRRAFVERVEASRREIDIE